VILLLLASCGLTNPANDDRCRGLERELDQCLGTEALPISCDQLSDNDIAYLESTLDLAGCEAVTSLLPMDADPLAASCNLLGEGCIDDQAIPAYQDTSTRYPIVMVNGIDVSPLFSWSDRVVEVMEDAGHSVHLAVVPPYDSTVSRSTVLWDRVQEVKEETGAAKVNLLCHSLGGLDCRYLVSPGGLHWDLENTSEESIAGSVSSVTTVATAHHGTPVADLALGYLTGEDSENAIDALATTLGEWFSGETLDHDVDLRASIAALTESQSLAFNAEIVDAPGIYYQSWAGFSSPFGEDLGVLYDMEELEAACATDGPGNGLALYTGHEDHMSLALAPAYDMVGEYAAEEEDGFAPNDGLCPVSSARWGRFRGCVTADHQEQLGRGNIPDTNVRNSLDIAAFYAAMAQDLAEQGH